MPDETKGKKAEGEKTEDSKKPRSGKVDLNKLRAARLEKLGVGPVVLFGDQAFQCPPEVPFVVIEAFAKMDTAQKADDDEKAASALISVVEGLLGSNHSEFMALTPSTEDMAALIEHVFEEYGLTAGESAASGAS